MHELDHYIYPHRVLHWLVAVAVLLSLASGLTLGFLGYERAVAFAWECAYQRALYQP